MLSDEYLYVLCPYYVILLMVDDDWDTAVCDRKWSPCTPGLNSVFDVGNMFAKGVRLVPFTGSHSGDLQYLVSQASWIEAFNQSPQIRLAGVAHVTGEFPAKVGGGKFNACVLLTMRVQSMWRVKKHA